MGKQNIHITSFSYKLVCVFKLKPLVIHVWLGVRIVSIYDFLSPQPVNPSICWCRSTKATHGELS